MFTGIIEEIGMVKAIKRGSSSVRMTIACSKVLKDISRGDSIAVNGICLTAVDFGHDWLCADVMPETIRKTALNTLHINSSVNLERALRLTDRLGGHIVSGHIDGTGTIMQIQKEDNAIWLTVQVHEEILKYIVDRGSVAVDGTSLTAAFVDDSSFKVSLIPHTAGFTILGSKKEGEVVNIECDIIGKYVEKMLNRSQKNNNQGITLNFLEDNGFL